MRPDLGPARGLVHGLILAVILWAIIALIVAAVAVCSPPLRIAEDDAGWIPALYGNGRGHVDVFASPFPSLRMRDVR